MPSAKARWVDQRFNDRYFHFIKRGLPGLVLYVRKNSVVEMELGSDTILLFLTAHNPRNDDPDRHNQGIIKHKRSFVYLNTK